MLYGTSMRTPSKRRVAGTPTPGKVRKVRRCSSFIYCKGSSTVCTCVSEQIQKLSCRIFFCPLSSMVQSPLQPASSVEPCASLPSRNHLCLPARYHRPNHLNKIQILLTAIRFVRYLTHVLNLFFMVTELGMVQCNNVSYVTCVSFAC